MSRLTYYKWMFYVAAIFNWLAAATVIAKIVVPGLIPLDTPFNSFGGQTFALFAALFGYGYFLVARDPPRNEGIVELGIIGKLLTFGLFLVHAIAGTIPYALVIPTIGDAIFALLFLEFLLVGRAHLAKG